MKVSDIFENKDFTQPMVIKHPEIKYPNMYDNSINWGANKAVSTKDVVVRDSNTKSIYGRRQIVQRER